MKTRSSSIKKQAKRLVQAMLLSVLASTSFGATIKITDGLEVPVYEDVTGEYKFAHGFGLIYGAMPVIRYLGAVEKMFPNAKISWQNIFTTSQQRDAMLAGSLDFGSCTPGPYLQAWDRGVKWKWLQTTSGFDGYLMVRPDGPSKVEDFIGSKMKMSPGPNTAQYFAVQQYLHDHGKDVHALDLNWANLPHPDAMQALIAGQLDGHFATSDFALRLQEQGMKKITSIREIYGALYPVGACALDETVKKHPKLAQGYAEGLRLVVAWMKAHPKEAAEQMSKSTDGRESVENFQKYMKSAVFDSFSKDANLKAYAESLHTLGAIKKLPKQASDIYAYPGQAGDKW